MSVADVAKALVAKCSQGQFEEAMKAHYAPNIVSIEPCGNEQMPARQEGIEAIEAKGRWWVENHEIHSMEVNGPFVGDGDQFAVQFKMDVTFKPTGSRMQNTEMALYTVKDGKIVQEEFFYHAPGM